MGSDGRNDGYFLYSVLFGEHKMVYFGQYFNRLLCRRLSESAHFVERFLCRINADCIGKTQSPVIPHPLRMHLTVICVGGCASNQKSLDGRPYEKQIHSARARVNCLPLN
jgi:hypothetical protein